MAGSVLRPQPLTKAAFARFGDVIEIDGAEERLINQGTTRRFHDLAAVAVAKDGGHPLISIFRGSAFALPITIAMFERHPLGSQAFFPLNGRSWLVVVATDDGGRPGEPTAFLATGCQGVNYAPGVWHHPLLALHESSDFLVVDRGGGGINLEEVTLDQPVIVEGYSIGPKIGIDFR
ncbi:ureidoglycolate lyase [Jiella sp. MQZ9-1]|uniref:Ureidoglycolate lyase n=1 Tax=Jiella flava TaxID=2816857 RepID=A0A939JT51_9HYPH|nr:ureidoglycolate lyase [Jiella flava]MBO0663618.1 ureidoglycolate lyase [Jiella flava]MCD2472193.1 ureidoglycolate lyase [Jiella flava]